MAKSRLPKGLKITSRTKWEGVKGCPCKVGAKKRKCGIRGLRGTTLEHAHQARTYLDLGEFDLKNAESTCVGGRSAATYATKASAEIRWLPPGQERARLLRRSDRLAGDARVQLEGCRR